MLRRINLTFWPCCLHLPSSRVACMSTQVIVKLGEHSTNWTILVQLFPSVDFSFYLRGDRGSHAAVYCQPVHPDSPPVPRETWTALAKLGSALDPPTTTLQLPRRPHAPPERPFSGSHLQTNIKVWEASLKRDQGPCGTLSSFICPCSQIAELLPGCQSLTIFQCRTLNTLGATKKKGGIAEGLGGEVGSQWPWKDLI